MYIRPWGPLLATLGHQVLVDARMRKHAAPEVLIGYGELTIGLGPGQMLLRISRLGLIAGIVSRTSPDLPARDPRRVEQATEVGVCSSRSLEALRLGSGFFQPVRHTHLLV